MVARDGDHRPVGRGRRHAERVALALDDERGDGDGVELGQPGLQRRVRPAARRVQREGQAENRGGARRRGGPAGHPCPRRPAAADVRQAAQGTVPKSGDHRGPCGVKLTCGGRGAAAGHAVGLLDERDGESKVQRGRGDGFQVGGRHRPARPVAEHQGRLRSVGSVQVHAGRAVRRVHRHEGRLETGADPATIHGAVVMGIAGIDQPSPTSYCSVGLAVGGCAACVPAASGVRCKLTATTGRKALEKTLIAHQHPVGSSPRWSLLRRSIATVAVMALLGAAFPALAAAGTDHWFSGTLGGNQAYSSGQVHTWTRIEGDVSTGSTGWCVARLSGAGGRITSPGSSFCDAYPVGGQAVAYYSGGLYHALANDYNFLTEYWLTSTHGIF